MSESISEAFYHLLHYATQLFITTGKYPGFTAMHRMLANHQLQHCSAQKYYRRLQQQIRKVFLIADTERVNVLVEEAVTQHILALLSTTIQCHNVCWERSEAELWGDRVSTDGVLSSSWRLH